MVPKTPPSMACRFPAGIHANASNVLQRNSTKGRRLPPEAAPAWSGRFPPWTAAPSGREQERPENAGGRREGWGHTRAATEMGTAVSWSPLPPSSGAGNLHGERTGETLNYLPVLHFWNLVHRDSSDNIIQRQYYMVRCFFENKTIFKSQKHYLIH